VIEVVRAGRCDLVMDLGRPDWGALGVPAGGAADPAALEAANRLAGNPVDAAGLEITLSGPTLRFPDGAMIALVGAPFAGTRSGGAAVPWNETLALAAGEVLTLGAASAGCRCWLAVHGGLAVMPVLGSRSTFLPARFGGFRGRPLRTGDELPCGAAAAGVRRTRARPPDEVETALRVVAGPQAEGFDDAALVAFFGQRYRLEPASDRRGLRLCGAPLRYRWPCDLPSQGVLPGAIQVPPDGQPIVLGWDGPVTGGYPVIAGVISADWGRLAQLTPGDWVRFTTVDVGRAREYAAQAWTIEMRE
jgi:biotin-dependent carboxylase-like uncharacterized protein